MNQLLTTNKEYKIWLESIKSKISTSRIRIALSVNSEVIRFYYMLGKEISIATKNSEWGSKLIPQLSNDLKSEYPDVKGFSTRNLKYMRFFYDFYSDEIGQQSVAQLEKDSVAQNISVFDKYGIDQIPWGQTQLLFIRSR